MTVLDDLSTGELENLSLASATGQVEVVVGSMLDDHALGRSMEGVEAVFHLAVQCIRKSLGSPLENHEINATGTLRTLECARRHRVKRFVYCSSSEVYGNASTEALDEQASACAPTTVYGASKLAGECYALAYFRTYGLPAVVVRPFNAYGPREHDQGVLAEVIPRFVIRVLNGLPPIIFGDGSQGRDFTYVTDTARGLAQAITSDSLLGAIVNIGQGKLTTILELASEVLRQCGRPDLGVSFAPNRPGEIQALIAGTGKAYELLGFRPEINLEQGLGSYIGWFREKYPDPALCLEADPVNWSMPERSLQDFR